jgi:hypothetical protein
MYPDRMAAIQADTRKPERLIAIDWSGDKTTSGQKKKIWIADWNDGQVTLTSGRTREEAAEYLIAAASQTPRLVAGLDFAFSYPAWFLREENCRTAAQFWQLVANGKGEDWLRECSPPFWGRPGRRCPVDHRPPASKGFRQTDRLLNEGRGTGGIQPKSPFQIGGAGAVGTGSLRGIPVLNKLRQAGFSIWPFTPHGFPAVLEIYPRLFTGPGNKSSRQFRAAHLAQSKYAALPEGVLTEATGSEDAFDALCSVIGMKDHADELARLQQATDPGELLEGKIWRPSAA